MEGTIMLNESVHPLLADNILATLASKKIINVYDFVEADTKLLFNITPLSIKNICDIKEVIMKQKAATMISGFDLYNELSKTCMMIPSHIKELDDLLGGGFQTGYIYEICGESASGKTLLCYNIINNLPENQKVYYIDAKVNFSTAYLKFLMNSQNKTNDYIKNKLGNILIKSIFSLNELLLSLYNIKEEISNGLSIKCIIINSISVIYYTEETEYAYSMINLIANILRLLTSNYQIVILVTNLITTWTEGNLAENCVTSTRLSCGNYWRSVPHARIKISKCKGYLNKFNICVLKSCIFAENKFCDILVPLNAFENIVIKFSFYFTVTLVPFFIFSKRKFCIRAKIPSRDFDSFGRFEAPRVVSFF